MRDPGPGSRHDEVLGPRSTTLQTLRRLSGRRKARRDAGEFVIDGPTLVREALDAGTDVVEIYVEERADELRRAIVDQAEGRTPGRTPGSVAVRVVADGALAKVTDPVTSQGCAARARIPSRRGLDDVAAAGGLIVVLEGLADPGNVGTLIRASEAAGAAAVVSCADGVDPWNPKAVRAAAGALFRTPVVEASTIDAVAAALGQAGVPMIATVLDAARAPDELDLSGNVAVLLGSEAHGLSADAVHRADARVTIPMAGAVESLNVAMAGTLVVFEAARQRRAAAASSAADSSAGSAGSDVR